MNVPTPQSVGEYFCTPRLAAAAMRQSPPLSRSVGGLGSPADCALSRCRVHCTVTGTLGGAASLPYCRPAAATLPSEL